jgi:hypothetical protein
VSSKLPMVAFYPGDDSPPVVQFQAVTCNPFAGLRPFGVYVELVEHPDGRRGDDRVAIVLCEGQLEQHALAYADRWAWIQKRDRARRGLPVHFAREFYVVLDLEPPQPKGPPPCTPNPTA